MIRRLYDFNRLPGARAAYRAPEWAGALAFAGEATQDSMMTMNAAIDSGRRAAAEVLAAWSKRSAQPVSRL